MSKQSYIKPNKLKVFRDLLVRGRYEEILSKSITNLIANNVHKESIKILDFGSGIEPTILQMVRKKLLEKSIKSISHGYDLYDENELKKLLEISETERFNIIFRFKQRLSLIIIDNKDIMIPPITIDLLLLFFAI